MPRVATQSTSSCRVHGRIFGGGAGRQIVITLERPCVWRGTLVPMRFETTTDDDGRFEIMLPPTEQMTDRAGGPAPLYQFVAEQVGSWQFAVPNVPTWSVAHG